jgi:hypothetical protein
LGVGLPLDEVLLVLKRQYQNGGARTTYEVRGIVATYTSHDAIRKHSLHLESVSDVRRVSTCC